MVDPRVERVVLLKELKRWKSKGFEVTGIV